MTNKGQSLVIFVLTIPIIFIILAAIFEIGNYSITQSKYESEVKETISYGLKHINEENIYQKIIELLDKNISGTKEIEITENKIKIHTITPHNTTFNKIFKKNTNIDISFTGYKEDNKIIINKD